MKVYPKWSEEEKAMLSELATKHTRQYPWNDRWRTRVVWHLVVKELNAKFGNSRTRIACSSRHCVSKKPRVVKTNTTRKNFRWDDEEYEWMLACIEMCVRTYIVKGKPKIATNWEMVAKIVNQNYERNRNVGKCQAEYYKRRKQI